MEEIRKVIHFENGIKYKILITHVIEKVSSRLSNSLEMRFDTLFYSGLTLNQYGVASPCRTTCTVCGFVALSWFKFNPLYWTYAYFCIPYTKRSSENLMDKVFRRPFWWEGIIWRCRNRAFRRSWRRGRLFLWQISLLGLCRRRGGRLPHPCRRWNRFR